MDERLDSIQQFEAYLKRRAPERRTAIDYVSDIRQFAASCAKAWRAVTFHDIDAFIDQQRQAGLSGATIKRRVYSLKVFFDFLAEERDELAWPNPVRFKRHAGQTAKRVPRDLTDEQVGQLWAVISRPRDRAWFALMLRAGLRLAEVVGLTLTCLLSPPGPTQPARLRVEGKGQKERVVLLSADAYAVLAAWLAVRPASEHEALFLNEHGQPLSGNGIEWLLRGYSQQAGLKVTPHQLRHTYARQLLEGGMPLTSLAKLMGHSQVSTTEIYTAGADPELAQAYQQIMGQLSHPPSSWPDPSPAASPAPAPTPPVAPAQPVKAGAVSLPDWESWATELPEKLRQASLAFVKRQVARWKPQRQRVNSLKSLHYLASFWRWQMAYRPISQPDQLRRADLQAFQQARLTAGKQATTINRQLEELLALLRELVEQGQSIDPAIFRLVHLAQPERLPRALAESEYQCLETYVYQRLEQPDPLVRLENACFFVLAHTGLRASECVDLQGQDLDLSGQRLLIRQAKGQRDRVVYLSETVSQALRVYLGSTRPQPQEPLFRRPTGQPLTYQWLHQHMGRLGQAAGQITLTPHQLRHTLATRLLNAGMKETRIQKILGHKHLSTTMIYARVLDPTVEADYRQAMAKIERQQMPLSTTPALITNWPIPDRPNSDLPVEPIQTKGATQYNSLDNSV